MPQLTAHTCLVFGLYHIATCHNSPAVVMVREGRGAAVLFIGPCQMKMMSSKCGTGIQRSVFIAGGHVLGTGSSECVCVSCQVKGPRKCSCVFGSAKERGTSGQMGAVGRGIQEERARTEKKRLLCNLSLIEGD